MFLLKKETLFFSYICEQNPTLLHIISNIPHDSSSQCILLSGIECFVHLTFCSSSILSLVGKNSSYKSWQGLRKERAWIFAHLGSVLADQGNVLKAIFKEHIWQNVLPWKEWMTFFFFFFLERKSKGNHAAEFTKPDSLRPPPSVAAQFPSSALNVSDLRLHYQLSSLYILFLVLCRIATFYFIFTAMPDSWNALLPQTAISSL